MIGNFFEKITAKERRDAKEDQIDFELISLRATSLLRSFAVIFTRRLPSQ